ncbi:unnamed protein product [Orchesella dallaii]|uniref:Uncharacterized protein n=1 Tax=Orchesella dallaii TaxID=48710 RepID=A0ABP1R1E6_9HEXA
MTAINTHQPYAKMMRSCKKRLTQPLERTGATDSIASKTMLEPMYSVASNCHIASRGSKDMGKEKVKNTNRWSPIGTIADHRMTNNNRIRKWHIFAVILWLIFIVQVTVVNGYPDPAPTPIHVSNSYTKTVRNNIPTSSTSRSTVVTAFLPSDAIPTSTSSVSSVAKNNSKNKSINNATHYDSRSVSASRKDFSTSIDRPFYTKITSNDAVAKPNYNSRGRMPTKKPKKSKNSSSSKYSKSKTTTEKSINSYEDVDDGDYFLQQTTEKSYHHPPPKLSLEPFFNFLTSLATASREVIMSKEQQQQQPPAEHIHPSSNKYSPSYETINQSIREGAKRSKKSKKGKAKKGNKGKKDSKKEKGSKRHRNRAKSEEEEEDEQQSEGPIPIPLPNPIIDSAENEENDSPINSPGLHILDILRTPMIPDYESPPPRVEPLMAAPDYYDSETTKNNMPKNSSSSSSLPSNPPSGRANLNKGQGYNSFDQQDNTQGTGSNKQREKQRSERDPVESFHEQSMEIQAEESINHAQVVPTGYGMKNNVGAGLVPSHPYHNHNQQQPQHQQINDPSTASSQASPTQAKSPEFGKSETDIFGQSHPNGKDDLVSKYPTTFVYKPHPSGPPPPGSRPLMSPSPPGLPPNVLFGPPSSSRPPFRMNKLRPNLHSYYDSSYHNYAAAGENLGNDMYGMRRPPGPPFYKPHGPPYHMPMPPSPSPPRYNNGYGSRPPYNMHPHGSHYVGHTFPSSVASKDPGTQPYESDSPSGDYEQDLTGNNNNGDSLNNQEVSGSDITGSASDLIDPFSVSDIDDNSLAAENSETKKIGIMESFDLFYKDYKILTWVAFFFITSLSLLSLLVYLYINNPPTEVVQARELFPWDSIMKNPQVVKFLSSFIESKNTRSDDNVSPYLKPYGNGFGSKSGRQKRKQTRSNQDKEKFIERRKRLNRRNESNQNQTSPITQSTTNLH